MASTSQAASMAHDPSISSAPDAHSASPRPKSPAPVSPASQFTQSAQTVAETQLPAPSSPAGPSPEPRPEGTLSASQNGMAPLPAPYDRHQYPIQGFPPPGFTDDPRRVVVARNKSWAYAKVGMNLCNLMAGAAVLGLSCSYLVYRVGSDSLYIINMPVSIGSILWTLGSLITLIACNRGFRLDMNSHEGIHPGAQVGMHLVLWLAWALAVAITSSDTGNLQRAYDRCISADKGNQSLSGLYPHYSDYTYECRTEYQGKEDRIINSDIPRLRATAVLSAVAFVLHFALFIGACVDTHYHNINKRARVVYVAAPAPMVIPPPPRGGWSPTFIASPPPGMTHPLGPIHQQPFDAAQPGSYNRGMPQPQHYQGPPRQYSGPQQHQYYGEKSVGTPAPMMSSYYAPPAPAPVASQPQPVQPQIPLGGYYAPSRGM